MRKTPKPSPAGALIEPIGPLATHVVLVHPEIHWNTGNAGRTCLAAGATLHLIEPLGFSLADRELKRAGLDYWEHLDLRVWPSWDAFEHELPTLGEPYFFSPKATRLVWDAPLGAAKGVVLVFGAKPTGYRPSFSSDIVIALSRCRFCRRSSGHSICRRAWQSRCTRSSGSAEHQLADA